MKLSLTRNEMYASSPTQQLAMKTTEKTTIATAKAARVATRGERRRGFSIMVTRPGRLASAGRPSSQVVMLAHGPMSARRGGEHLDSLNVTATQEIRLVFVLHKQSTGRL